MCAYIYIYIYIHIYIYIYIDIYIHLGKLFNRGSALILGPYQLQHIHDTYIHTLYNTYFCFHRLTQRTHVVYALTYVCLTQEEERRSRSCTYHSAYEACTHTRWRRVYPRASPSEAENLVITMQWRLRHVSCPRCWPSCATWIPVCCIHVLLSRARYAL